MCSCVVLTRCLWRLVVDLSLVVTEVVIAFWQWPLFDPFKPMLLAAFLHRVLPPGGGGCESVCAPPGGGGDVVMCPPRSRPGVASVAIYPPAYRPAAGVSGHGGCERECALRPNTGRICAPAYHRETIQKWIDLKMDFLWPYFGMRAGLH